MKLVIAVLLIAVAANTAALAQYVFDAKGRAGTCLPGDSACSTLPPPRARLQPLPQKRRPPPAPYVPCGSRCDLLDRMK
jgi:hypothetical protein